MRQVVQICANAGHCGVPNNESIESASLIPGLPQIYFTAIEDLGTRARLIYCRELVKSGW